ncbi:ribose-5-phosphate isomerase RpiA [Rubrobacter marinus]|uniref:Ribose-5-phosphate isomerase A n=1 Tax=Rubrobacter marinus TaxID=2653852 RepID=A0A6G8PZW8_9ACTN|nr:ribose-5-phosphate isomerase RpiA [Rubrobacter marinus]QIN79752.1 ribose-5-phosphate isomerase RpiA [Rubrobacter marinus]
MTEDLKRAAAEKAVEEYVESGDVVGLGTGSTASHAVRRIGQLIAAGELHGIRGVPTSARTAALAREAGIPLVDLADSRPAVTIDGADEIAPDLSVVKGLGGALLREKIVAHASLRGLVVVADGSKSVGSLGGVPLPVEVEPFGYEATLAALASLGCEPTLRLEGQGSQTGDPGRPYVTDGGHYTADCLFPDGIAEPGALETEIKRIPGALETGLFVGLAHAAVVARADGIEIMEGLPKPD